ncbi:MAG: DASH complex subunit dam1 [Phylliscum demangeonii]|nr:MAG: DASH complex subunit dam1 [Phylliscum demangeonii]
MSPAGPPADDGASKPGNRPPSRPPAPSRPTTPLRSISRSSFFRDSQQAQDKSAPSAFPLDSLEPVFAELSDSMADLEVNFMHLQLMHESLARFSENFASFLYGLNMNAFCVDFPEAPIRESFQRQQQAREHGRPSAAAAAAAAASTTDRVHEDINPDATFMSVFIPGSHSAIVDAMLSLNRSFVPRTTDTSFVEHPSTTKTPSKFATPAPRTAASSSSRIRPPATGKSTRGTTSASTRGGTSSRLARAAANAARGSGIARARGRYTKS